MFEQINTLFNQHRDIMVDIEEIKKQLAKEETQSSSSSEEDENLGKIRKQVKLIF